MRDRDKEIIESVERFRCMSRDQIAQIYFRHCRNPKNNANNVLKRLRDRKYLTVAPYRQPYVYLSNPATIKRDSNKIDHYLGIVDVYLQLRVRFALQSFLVEPRYDADVRPDVFAMLRNSPFFIEVQNSAYGEKVMQKKIDRYEDFYDSREWHQFKWQPKERKFFPYVILLSKEKYNFNTRNVQVFQFKDIHDFLNSLGISKRGVTK